MKKKIYLSIVLVFFALSLAFSIYKTSADNFSNIGNEFENKRYSLEEIQFVNWYGEDGDYTSFSDPQIIFEDEVAFIHTIKLAGYYSNSKLNEVVLYYIDPRVGYEQVKTVPCYITGNKIYITADVMATYVRIDITEDPNMDLSLRHIEINDRSIVVGINSVAKWCLLPTIILGFALFIALWVRDIKPYFVKLKQYIPLINNLVSRDLKVKYRRSVLGFLWSILNPLLMALVIHTVFSRLFRFQVEYFATYYLIGSLVFNFVIDATANALGSIIGAAGLIKKVYIPKYIFPIQKCVFAFVNMLFGCVAVVVVMIIQGVPFAPTIFLFPIPMIYAFIFACGFGLVLASMTVFFRDIQHLYSVFTAVWMYLTPIIYPEEMLLSNGLGIIMKLNPMYYYTHYLRSLVMYGTIPSFSENIICIVYAALMLVVGVLFFKKTQDKFILHI